MAKALAYCGVLVLAVELAVWECFLVPQRVLGAPVPLSAVLAAVGNALLGRAGTRVLGASAGALGPALCWAVIALGLALPGPLGDAVVPGTVRGTLFLVAGLVSAAWVVGTARAPRATPSGLTRR